jgi:hypothetical protein
LQLKLKIKKRPHSFNHNCNHYSLPEGEQQKKKSKTVSSKALLWAPVALCKVSSFLYSAQCHGVSWMSDLFKTLKVTDQRSSLFCSRGNGGNIKVGDIDYSSSGRAALSTIPSALVRWNEESRVIDGDSVHDCVTALKPDILQVNRYFT